MRYLEPYERPEEGLLLHYRPNTCGICQGAFRPSLDKRVVLYNRNYPVGPWRMEVFGTEDENLRPTEDGSYLFDYESSCVIVHQFCYRFLALLRTPDEGPDFVGRTVSSLMVGVNSSDPRIPDPLGFSPFVLDLASRKFNLPGMTKLPPEVVVTIQRESNDAPLWCFARAVALRMELCSMPRGTDMVPFKLANVYSWTRGDKAAKRKKGADRGFRGATRITLDHRGISKVEAFCSHRWLLTEKGTGAERYILADHERMKRLDSEIYFKDGLAWLPSEAYGQFIIWDTPTPPQSFEYDSSPSEVFELESCAMPLLEWCCLPSNPTSIDLTACRGLTFVYHSSKGFPQAIHAHYRNSRGLLNKPKADPLEVYVPLPPDDKILSMFLLTDLDTAIDPDGVKYVSFIIRTRLAGSIYVGPQQIQPYQEHSQSPEAIFHDQGLRRSAMVAIYPIGNKQSLYNQNPRRRAWDMRKQRQGMLWSWAPLKNVARVSVYTGMYGGLRGMHIVYENGAQRTMGQGPGSLESRTTWMKPSTMFWQKPDKRFSARVMFDNDPAGKPWDREWHSVDMVGEMHLWISKGRQYFEVLPAGRWRRL